MLIHPEINPVALAFGPLQIHWYGIMYVLGFVCAYALVYHAAKRQEGWSHEALGDLVFYGALGVIIGGRVGYVLFYGFDQFLANPLWLFKVWQGGMSFHGGFLGVMFAMWVFSRVHHKTPFQIFDFIVPATPLGLMFGRLGNFINGELWGRPVIDPDYPLAMIFRHVDMLPRHPSQLYEALAEGLLLFLLLFWFSAKPRPRMAVSAVFLLGYGAARFVIEFYREPDIGQGFIWLGWVTKGQILTLPMIIAGIFMLYFAYRKPIYDWAMTAQNTKTTAQKRVIKDGHESISRFTTPCDEPRCVKV